MQESAEERGERGLTAVFALNTEAKYVPDGGQLEVLFRVLRKLALLHLSRLLLR